MQLTIQRRLKDAELLAIARAAFPAPGGYIIAKAAEAETEGAEFGEWFLRELDRVAHENFLSAQQAIWEVLDQLLVKRGVRAPSELGLWELNRTLFALGAASTARMVGLNVAPEVAKQLTAIGFTPQAVLDFPALAYRMGAIYNRLAQRDPVQWPELLELAKSFPLSSAERAAIEYARTRAGLWLTPVYDSVGRVWTAEREIAPLQDRIVEALRTRKGVAEVARELGASQRAQGILRDARRVVRVELAQARCEGSWAADSKKWGQTELLFRQTSSRACRGCLRLLKNRDGTPRLWPRKEVEAQDALGPNRGHWREWHLRIGIIHPNCLCAPWARHVKGMESIFAQRAPEYAALMLQLGVLEEAA